MTTITPTPIAGRIRLTLDTRGPIPFGIDVDGAPVRIRTTATIAQAETLAFN